MRPDDWKRNHRIWEYHEDDLTQELLGHLTREAYAAHIQGWKSKEGLKDLLRVVRANKSARKVIVGNLFNPVARRRLREGFESTTT